MKKILVGLLAVVLIGGGCVSSRHESAEKNVLPRTYTNEKYGYTFVLPANFAALDGNSITVPAPAGSNSNPVEVLVVEEGIGPNDRTIFLAEKTTVYPESKIGQLRARYFKRDKNVIEQKIIVGEKSGWELKNTNENAGSTEVYRVLFFPNGENDFIVIQETNQPEHSEMINSLHFTK